MVLYFCLGGWKRIPIGKSKAVLKRFGLPIRSNSIPANTCAQIIDDSQTVNNACASVALLNIVNNIPEIELGDHLRNFKEFTMSFSPALRGDAISNFEFVKEIHNSFARYVLGLSSLLSGSRY